MSLLGKVGGRKRMRWREKGEKGERGRREGGRDTDTERYRDIYTQSEQARG